MEIDLDNKKMKIYVCYTYRYDDDYGNEYNTEFWHTVYSEEQDAKDWIVKYKDIVKAYEEFSSESARQIKNDAGFKEREALRVEHTNRLQNWLDSNPFVQELIRVGCLSGDGLAELDYTYCKYKELELEFGEDWIMPYKKIGEGT